ncbi:uncharacterized protein PHACADRAFT_179933 [Phanerochaete carnosa HHB-10118-sp]|uniref:Uncharacterized protein n=1 Tax=Phanerochaete carnosa (strain HHB-10118-sp) TaxID=650164 RepID=K5WNF8_PHACS|nr:uncharacterized protein PHACADRAFT_179933 [Phanerochaete carnosa HHB-10118-sp]EKM60749.1 hypothetical protein PHACADRAFT_179933 [Phanerochaete carnosa HHB-10118-sp]
MTCSSNHRYGLKILTNAETTARGNIYHAYVSATLPPLKAIFVLEAPTMGLTASTAGRPNPSTWHDDTGHPNIMPWSRDRRVYPTLRRASVANCDLACEQDRSKAAEVGVSRALTRRTIALVAPTEEGEPAAVSPTGQARVSLPSAAPSAETVVARHTRIQVQHIQSTSHGSDIILIPGGDGVDSPVNGTVATKLGSSSSHSSSIRVPSATHMHLGI